jgi:hypothetical protein
MRVTADLEPVVAHILRGTAKSEDLLPDRLKVAHSKAMREYREYVHRDNTDNTKMQVSRPCACAELCKDNE